MTPEPRSRRAPSCLVALIGFALVITLLVVVFEPDRPIATIEPGSSAGPAFAVQVRRPRAGLPLGGLLPPEVFGFEEHLGFDSTSPGATVMHAGPRRLELAADGWQLTLVLDDDGRVSADSEVRFTFLFEEQPREVCCRPGDPVVATVSTTRLPDGALAGSFDIELPHCADADTGEDLGWPPRPLVLRGSFDRLPLGGDR